MPTEHKLTIMDSHEWSVKQAPHVKYAKSVGEQRYPLIVVCSCQWQSFAPDQQYAEAAAAEHVRAQQRLGPGAIPQGRL